MVTTSPVTTVWSLDIDVTGVAGLPGPLHTQVSVHLPPRDLIPDRPLVVFAFPGGGASRGMWCMEAPDTLAYSQARWHAERGVVFVSCDHLGTGGSAHPPREALGAPHVLAWVNQATVEGVLRLLADDAVAPGYGPVIDPRTVGMGHSMGSNLTIVLQAHRAVFDAVAILGYSAIHTALPMPPDIATRPPRRAPRGHPQEGRNLVSEPGDQIAGAVRRWMNRWDAEEAQTMKRHEWRIPLASPTMPPAAGFMNAAGVVAEEASWIECPVFLGFGERDVTRNHWEEPRWYWRAKDITLTVVPRMSHGLNSATTRIRMWRRLQHWWEGLDALDTLDDDGADLT